MLNAVQVSLTPEQKFQEYLSSRPRVQRFTGQQKDMVRFIFSSHEHFDADSLLEEMRKASLVVSRATAYRTLTKLVDAGLLRRLVTGSRTTFEHDYGYPQHDHLRCMVCNKMIEFEKDSSALLSYYFGDTLFNCRFSPLGKTSTTDRNGI
jgi:Fur family ferric uptake transcriptional regulator